MEEEEESERPRYENAIGEDDATDGSDKSDKEEEKEPDDEKWGTPEEGDSGSSKGDGK